MNREKVNKRRFLKGLAGAAATVGLAGCGSNGGDDPEPVTPEETPEENTSTPESTDEPQEDEEEKDDEASEDVEWDDILEAGQEARTQSYEIWDWNRESDEDLEIIDPTDMKYLEDPDLLLEDDPGAPDEWLDLYGEERHGVYTFTHGGDKFDLEHFEDLNDIDDMVQDAVTFYIHFADTKSGLGSDPSGATGHAAAFAQDIIHKVHPDQQVNIFGYSIDGHGVGWYIDEASDHEDGYPIRINDTTSNRQGNITDQPLSDRSGSDPITQHSLGSSHQHGILNAITSGERHHEFDARNSTVRNEMTKQIMSNMRDGRVDEDLYWRFVPALQVMMYEVIENDIEEDENVYIDMEDVYEIPRFKPGTEDSFDELYDQVTENIVVTDDNDEYDRILGR